MTTKTTRKGSIVSTAPSTTDQIRKAWDAVAENFDRYVTPRNLDFGEQVMARLALHPGLRVLDVATGTGALALPAARTGAEVVAVDIAPVMIERLQVRARDEGLTSLTAQVGDGEALTFDADTFDVAVSMNGVSLFADLDAGLAQLVRVTRPGGRVMLVTFGPLQRAEFIAFPMGAMAATIEGFTPPPADPPMPPFRLADPDTLRTTLCEAGLHDVTVDTATWDVPVESADDLQDVLMASNPIAHQLTAGMSDEQFGQVREVLDGMLRERSGAGSRSVLHAEMRIGLGTV